MNSKLLFDFIVDKQNNTMTIRREFAAPRQLVWDCYTKSELLNQWFAPQPLQTKTKSMEFRPGGHWHYAMVDGSSGDEYWGLTEYITIQPIDFYTSRDAFSNEAGEINAGLPRANWVISFTEKDTNTVVETVVTYSSLADLETVVNMGMEEGMTSTFTRLDELLVELKG
ncbi:SRPBCC domain-containing protein [Neolewinella lacunae]|uniref:SRPBCC domain-containing protein n=1 Tax=Neolewinella lacunae TaxID=1517758 RepID=A0A923PFC0_9BACT|nr:SRPBCC domain-containing protein [Neolewinella lacunae]MBC6993045.1 SRPBCC domain-containing protein [Neolewinella lacunae]MDN3635867.1 SRPBCC domain-containing protein [Neolewinella lacunae]